MNKTVTINISGIIFHIEEDAYDSLSKYLAAIKGYFSSTDGGNEIMGDIEARIAELLQEKLNPGKQVILMVDVDYVKNVMGRPEDFGGEGSKEENKNNSESEQFAYYEEKKVKRRLFRNPDEKAIGGVCSGIAAYLNIDTVWVRLAMFLLIFFGGLSLWVYIVLWIIIPQANTTAEKLAMRGESANINNIFQSFKDEAHDVKNRFEKNSKEYSRQFYDTSAKVRRGGAEVLNTLFNILGRLIGLFLLVMGVFLLFVYAMVLWGISLVDGNVDTSLSDWKIALFDSRGDYIWGVIAFIIVIGIPVFMLIYAGIKLLFKVRYSNRWLNLGLGLTWLIGFFIGCYVAGVTITEFSQNAKLKEVAELHGIGDTIVLKADPVAIKLKTMGYYNSNELETSLENNQGHFRFGESDKGTSLIGFASLNVVENAADSVEMILYQSAKGSSKKQANSNASAINYSYHRKGRELILDKVFYTRPGSKFRDQELDIKLKLPKGKVVYLDKSLGELLDDADNVTNTWTDNMLGRRWKMTDKGLECIDCNGLETKKVKDEEEDTEGLKNEHITINDNGINIKGSETEIKIDDNGIKIKTPEKELQIDNEGHKHEIKKGKKEKENAEKQP